MYTISPWLVPTVCECETAPTRHSQAVSAVVGDIVRRLRKCDPGSGDRLITPPTERGACEGFRLTAPGLRGLHAFCVKLIRCISTYVRCVSSGVIASRPFVVEVIIIQTRLVILQESLFKVESSCDCYHRDCTRVLVFTKQRHPLQIQEPSALLVEPNDGCGR